MELQEQKMINKSANTAELKKIKKMYGEDFMRMCRRNFPTILDNDGLLLDVLNSWFANNSRNLYRDIMNANLEKDFKSFICSKVLIFKDQDKKIESRTPFELFKQIGYDLIECKTEEDIQNFKKYYAKDEELCTFRDKRIKNFFVFFAVKNNVNDIKRENFLQPQREDEYGTSVMGIQFNKEGICTVSIKNRYNQSVDKPDATYGNDLDRIIPGLESSFRNMLLEKGVQLNSVNLDSFKIPGYVIAENEKFYKYNECIDGSYYCPGNIIIKDGKVNEIGNLESKILVDHFLIDMDNKEVVSYVKNIKDSFIDEFTNKEDIKKIQIMKENNSKENIRKILITKKNSDEPITIEINNDNQIIGYINKKVKSISDNFLLYNNSLKSLELDSIEKIGDNCLLNNKCLKNIFIAKLLKIGNNAFQKNESLSEFSAPNLKSIGDNLLYKNNTINYVNLNNLKQSGKGILAYNEKVNKKEILKNVNNVQSNLKNVKKNRVVTLDDIGSIHNEITAEERQEEVHYILKFFKKALQIVKIKNNKNADKHNDKYEREYE